MIYTVTFSPAIDYIIHMDALTQGEINRSKRETCHFGGKGINVSVMLERLGVRNTAMGFISGFTGRALEESLWKAGIDTDFVYLDEGITRINIKIKTDQETEINTQGASISHEKLKELFLKLDALKEGDILIVSGSAPSTIPEGSYETMLDRLEGKGIRLVIDTTGPLLKKLLKYRPFLVKPNKKELEELEGSKIRSDQALEDRAGALQKQGARNVLVSLGAEGAYLLSEDTRAYRMQSHSVSAVNTVGAGDSMVAGFLAGYLKTGDYPFALRLGLAAGSATACSEGLASLEKIKRFMNPFDRLDLGR